MRILMWFAAGFSAACGLGAYLYGQYLPTLAVLALLVSIGLFLFRGKPFVRITAIAALGLCVGICWFLGFDRCTLRDARSVDGQICGLTVTALDYSTETEYGCGFTGEVRLGSHNYDVRVYLHSGETVQPGDLVNGQFLLKIHITPGEKPDYLSGNGIYLTAHQRSDGVQILSGTVQWRHYPQILRQKLLDILDKCIPGDAAGFAKALLLGDTSGIDYATDRAFQTTGISHVIAVSGMHVSILFSLLYVISGRHRLITAVLGIPVILVFAAVAGWTPSIVRAAIMQCLFIMALLLDRDYDPLTALGFAGLIMLLENPMVITSVSFQLSFACMVGIFLFYIPLQTFLLGKWKHCALRKAVAASAAVTISAMVFTTPLTALYFGSVSLIGVVTNLATLWLISIIFYGLIAVCTVYFLSSALAAALGGLLDAPIRMVLATAKLLSGVPLAAVYTESVYITVWLVFSYGLFFIHLLKRKKQTVLLSALAALGLCLSLCFSWAEPLLFECQVTAVDVGQGQCILLQSRGKTFLVDCGGSYGPTAADRAVRVLRSQGIGRLDGVILTHYDSDHTGGVEYLLQEIDTCSLYLPYTEDPDGVGMHLEEISGKTGTYISQDTVLSFGDTKLTVFAPISYESGNESSMCILFQTKNCDILITGDRGTQTERILLEHHDLPKLEVLVVGHHGAKTSTGQELLEKTVPEYAIISVGEENSYDHPAEETLERLRAFGCKILRTDSLGTVRFRR